MASVASLHDLVQHTTVAIVSQTTALRALRERADAFNDRALDRPAG